MLSQRIEGVNVAEERGLVGRHGIDDLAMEGLVRIGSQHIDQGFDRSEVFLPRQRPQP
jgi:hypothetical protein